MRHQSFRTPFALVLILTCAVLAASPALAAGPADGSTFASHWTAWLDLGARLFGWTGAPAAPTPERTTAASGHGMDPNGSPEATPSSGGGMDPDGSPSPTPSSGGGMDPNG